MMTIIQNNRWKWWSKNRGFSLIELMVVIAILGMLAAAVGIAINTADAKLKSFAFNLGSRFKQAKYEAMKRGRNVYIDFDFNDDNDPRNDNGYFMWVDNNSNAIYNPWTVAMDIPHGTVPANGTCDDDEGADCKIYPVPLAENVALFLNQANPAVGHPGPGLYDTTPAGGPATGPAGSNIGDGVVVQGAVVDRFRFEPSGDASAGSLYIYFPRGDVGSEVVAAGPWAIRVNTVGRIWLDEWKPTSGWVSDLTP